MGKVMEKVIWGAGARGTRFLLSRKEDDISFFIDSDKGKCKNHYGKEVIHPTQVKNWDDLFIYIPFNFHLEISNYLREKGLQEGRNFTIYNDSQVEVSAKRIKENVIDSLNRLQEVAREWRGKIIYIGCHKYIDNLTENGMDIKKISSDPWSGERITVPLAYHANTVVVNEEVGREKEDVLQIDYLKNAALQLFDMSCKMDFSSCCYLIHYANQWIEEFLNEITPRLVILSSSVNPAECILHSICRKRNIPIVFSHPGIFPGTFPFDTTGEMGESIPAIFSKEFRSLPVSDDELQDAGKTWEYLYKNRANRKAQPDNDITSYIKNVIDPERPTVFFAGSNDACSHMVPYTKVTREYHSPVFKSSIEAATYIAELCKKNQWNLLYKPHPIYEKCEEKSQLPDHVIYISEGDINDVIDCSDVVVTILSATNYNALVRYKPVVMLGYNQTRGKGCTYEAFEKEKIESELKKALQEGFTQEQQDAFLRHMAQCFKYYLYDDLGERGLRYGKSVPKSIDGFYELQMMIS